MPTVEWNTDIWDGWYDWSKQGDEWSTPWGHTEALWQRTILPRIKDFIPTGTILEIAPGFGRMTQYLKDACTELVAVDMSAKCIAACKERFKDSSNIQFHTNDGKDLSMVQDESIDFAFSYDSLVHVEQDVLDAYITQLAKKLKPGGVAFLHHSNLGEYRRYYSFVSRIPRGKKTLGRLGIIQWHHYRGVSASAAHARRTIESAGLVCCRQELVNFEVRTNLIDCFTTLSRKDSTFASQHEIVRNGSFMKEAAEGKKWWEQRVRSGVS